MTRIVRPMKFDPSDPQFPLIGTKGSCLGVRVAGNYLDVDFDEQGLVKLNRKGMSVSADWRNLEPHLIPEELEDDTNGARGKRMRVFVHGKAGDPFCEGSVAAGLELCYKSDSTDSGVVSPALPVAIHQYQDDLGRTRLDWVIDES